MKGLLGELSKIYICHDVHEMIQAHVTRKQNIATKYICHKTLERPKVT